MAFTTELSANINERIDSINARLDEVEQGLPAVPKAALRLNRAVTERVLDGNRRTAGMVSEAFENVSDVATKTYKSFVASSPVDIDGMVSTATKFAEDTVDFATTNFKQVAGSFGVAFDTAETEVAKKVTKAAKTVEASEVRAEKVDLNKKTKAELYEIAKDVDLDGRATMSKGELVKALAKKI